MAKQSDGNIGFNQKLQMLPPPVEKVLPVPVHLWKQIMQRIATCTDSSQTYVSLGWGLIGLGTSALLTALTLPLSVECVQTNGTISVVDWPSIITLTVLWIVAAAGMISGALSLHFSKRHAQDRQELRNIITEDMRMFSDRHAPDIAPSP